MCALLLKKFKLSRATLERIPGGSHVLLGIRRWTASFDFLGCMFSCDAGNKMVFIQCFAEFEHETCRASSALGRVETLRVRLETGENEGR